jgi:hypothetical protein
MVIHLKITGSLLVILAIVHVFFPKYFHWKEDLKTMRLINRQVMQVHTFFIAFVVLLIGILCLTQTDELIHTALGKNIALGLSVFWFVRLLFQQLVYSSKLWKGKIFETSIHILFTFFWLYFSTVFFLVFLGEN